MKRRVKEEKRTTREKRKRERREVRMIKTLTNRRRRNESKIRSREMKENEAEGEEIEKNMNGVKNRIEVRERGSMLAGRKVRETRKRVQASAADETTDARHWVVEEWEKKRRKARLLTLTTNPQRQHK